MPQYATGVRATVLRAPWRDWFQAHGNDAADFAVRANGLANSRRIVPRAGGNGSIVRVASSRSLCENRK